MPRRIFPSWVYQRLRINVRTLIVLVLIIGVGMGWIIEGVRIQREAVAALRSEGAFVRYYRERGDPSQWDDQAGQSVGKPGALKWIVDRLGVDYFDHPVSVALEKPESPSVLRHIEQLSQVKILDVHGPFVTDAWLARLAGRTNLASLNIGDRFYYHPDTYTPRSTASVTDAGMASLKHFAELMYLDLNGTQVGDAGLAHLAGLTRLEYLRLEATRVTDAGLVHLAKMTKLKEVELADTTVTDAGLVHLKSLTGLKNLGLRGTQITDAGLAHLEHLTGLRGIDLRDTRITHEGLVRLMEALPNLSFVQYLNEDPGPVADPIEAR